MNPKTALIDDLERRARTATTSLADGQRFAAEAQRLRDPSHPTVPRSAAMPALLRN